MEDDVPVGERRMSAAVPIRSNLSRLEHELQTVVDGSCFLSCRNSSECRRYRRHRCGGTRSPPARAARPVPAALLL
jgi:hypothetical protein